MNLLPEEYWFVTMIVSFGLAMIVIFVLDRIERMK